MSNSEKSNFLFSEGTASLLCPGGLVGTVDQPDLLDLPALVCFQPQYPPMEMIVILAVVRIGAMRKYFKNVNCEPVSVHILSTFGYL